MQAQPASTGCKIFEGEAAARRLTELGLREGYFSQAAIHGHERRERCQPVHPKSYAGQVMWAETLGELRTQLLELLQGWKMGRTGNYETAYNGPKQVAIAVVGGDTSTGERGFEPPMTARRRGRITEKRVQRNTLGQLQLPIEGIPDPAMISDEQCITWFFLINARENRLYSELSLPIAVGAKKRISAWAERILFAPFDLVGAVTPIEPDEALDENPTVHVGRK